MTKTEAAREARIRRALDGDGYGLRKDRARTPDVDHYGGFMIVDTNLNVPVAGFRCDLDLDEVEE